MFCSDAARCSTLTHGSLFILGVRASAAISSQCECAMSSCAHQHVILNIICVFLLFARSFHNANKIAQDVADPTLINNSYGGSSSTGNTSSTSYTIGYRGTTQTYTGTGSIYNIPSNSGGARCNATFTYHNGSSSTLSAYSASGKYITSGTATSSAAESAIAAGCIVVASASSSPTGTTTTRLF